MDRQQVELDKLKDEREQARKAAGGNTLAGAVLFLIISVVLIFIFPLIGFILLVPSALMVVYAAVHRVRTQARLKSVESKINDLYGRMS